MGTFATPRRFETSNDMLPKRLLAIILAAALAAMGGRVARAQWVQTNGPYGADVTCFVVSNSNLFAGTNQGVFLSSDTGKTWESKNNGLIGKWTYSLAAIGTRIFVGTDSGVFLSTDEGQTWIKASAGLATGGYPTPTPTSYGFSVMGTIIFAVTPGGGLCRSTNFGLTWKSVAISGANPFVIHGPTVCGTNLILNTYNGGVFRSSDSGIIWHPANAGIPGDSIAIGPFASIGKILFAAFAEASNADSILISTDGGESWKVNGFVNTNVETFVVMGSILFASSYNGGLWRSSDSGKSWIEFHNWYAYPPSLAVLGTNLFAGYFDRYVWGGLYISKDSGISFTPCVSGITNSNVSSLESVGTLLFATANDGYVYRSLDDGSNWFLCGSPWPFGAFGSKLFGTYRDSLYTSGNDGSNWAAIDSVEPGGVYAIIDSNLFMAGGWNGFFRSTDEGETWNRIDSGVPKNAYIISLSAIGRNLYSTLYTGGILLSTNNGMSWAKLPGNGLPDTILLSSSFAGFGNNLFLVTGPQEYGFFRSTDEGKNWSRINNDLTDSGVAQITASGTNVFATSGKGVILSTDSGKTWRSVNEGLGIDSLSIANIAVNEKYIFGGTALLSGPDGSGVWRRPLSDFGISAVSEPQQPGAVTIRAYPNPFTQSTTISFLNDAAGYAQVSIVNTLGVEVARLFSGELAPGAHRFTWMSPDVRNGMYECVVRMNGREQAVPVVLAR